VTRTGVKRRVSTFAKHSLRGKTGEGGEFFLSGPNNLNGRRITKVARKKGQQPAQELIRKRTPVQGECLATVKDRGKSPAVARKDASEVKKTPRELTGRVTGRDVSSITFHVRDFCEFDDHAFFVSPKTGPWRERRLPKEHVVCKQKGVMKVCGNDTADPGTIISTCHNGIDRGLLYLHNGKKKSAKREKRLAKAKKAFLH